MLKNMEHAINAKQKGNRTIAFSLPESALPVAVCASTFRNLFGREATSDELSEMTGIPAAAIISRYLPLLKTEYAKPIPAMVG